MSVIGLTVFKANPAFHSRYFRYTFLTDKGLKKEIDIITLSKINSNSFLLSYTQLSNNKFYFYRDINMNPVCSSWIGRNK